MSANPNYFTDRLNEATAATAVLELATRLVALNHESRPKRFAATREQRHALALEIVNKAESIAQRLATTPAVKRVPKTKRTFPEIPAGPATVPTPLNNDTQPVRP